LAGPCIGQLCGPVAREIAAGNPWITPDRYRGIRGLYGSYDSISPQTFRIFSTALSLGTTGQWRANDRFVVQGSALAGIGYAAVGTVHGGTERDHHYGTTPQALLALRLIDGDRTALDMSSARVLRHPRQQQRPRRPRQHRARRDQPDAPAPQPAHHHRRVPVEPAQGLVPRRRGRPPDPRHRGNLLHAAGPGPVRDGGLALRASATGGE
jgi:hypothetical protein